MALLRHLCPIAFLLPGAVLAQAPAPAEADRGAVGLQVLAQEAARLGEAEHNVLILLAAARLAALAPVLPGEGLSPHRQPGAAAEGMPEGTTDSSTGTTPPARPSVLPDAEQLLARASALAGDDPALLAVIARRKATPLPPAPTIRGHGVNLPPGMVDIWSLPLVAGVYREIAVLGDGAANLDLALTDADATAICTAIGAGDHLLCRFVPEQDGIFQLRVENTGISANSYTLLTE